MTNRTRLNPLEQLKRRQERLQRQPYKFLNFVWQIVVVIIGIPAVTFVLFPYAPVILCERFRRFRWLPIAVPAFLVVTTAIAYSLFGLSVAILAGVLILGGSGSALLVFLRPNIRTAVIHAIDFMQGSDMKPSYQWIKVLDHNENYCDLQFGLRTNTIPSGRAFLRVSRESGTIEEISWDQFTKLGVRPQF